ncbi:CMRF35-like molecule 2 isoform X4 [Halichoerus grypus]|uniref:CMRF35-like molecule 2 isoform X2 n=1 Tax=Halichoerus grypus TaxID=9711 RepID=UPI001659FB43|nr:CMRF35-like molecule 2 isoform X2 [Halichoerus grypus]
MWLSPVLLLLCLSGSLSLTGPSSVTGTLGGCLSVPCQYEEGYQRHNKYWCRGEFGVTCEKIVETKGEENEERSGRVSIRDHADNFTFIVTMENLTTDDAGSYWCRIQRTWFPDPFVQVNVSVSAAPKKTTERTTCQAVPAAFPGLKSKQNLSTKEVLTYCSGVGQDGKEERAASAVGTAAVGRVLAAAKCPSVTQPCGGDRGPGAPTR